MNKPVVFSDLDDTLFQTRRKMVDELALEPFRTGALDRSLTPRSFMTEEQAMLVDWLLEHADLIPVTARGTEEISRVQILPFLGRDHSWRGDPSSRWYARQRLKAHMLECLSSYADRLTSMQHIITELMDARGINAWARLNYEYEGTPVYLVMKHRDSTKLDELNAVGDEIERVFRPKGFTSTVTATTLPGYPAR